MSPNFIRAYYFLRNYAWKLIKPLQLWSKTILRKNMVCLNENGKSIYNHLNWIGSTSFFKIFIRSFTFPTRTTFLSTHRQSLCPTLSSPDALEIYWNKLIFCLSLLYCLQTTTIYIFLKWSLFSQQRALWGDSDYLTTAEQLRAGTEVNFVTAERRTCLLLTTSQDRFTIIVCNIVQDYAGVYECRNMIYAQHQILLQNRDKYIFLWYLNFNIM